MVNYHSKKKADTPERVYLLPGGPEEIRTPDPYNANVMRSQLRYGPMGFSVCLSIISRSGRKVKKRNGKIRSAQMSGADWVYMVN